MFGNERKHYMEFSFVLMGDLWAIHCLGQTLRFPIGSLWASRAMDVFEKCLLRLQHLTGVPRISPGAGLPSPPAQWAAALWVPGSSSPVSTSTTTWERWVRRLFPLLVAKAFLEKAVCLSPSASFSRRRRKCAQAEVQPSARFDLLLCQITCFHFFCGNFNKF